MPGVVALPGPQSKALYGPSDGSAGVSKAGALAPITKGAKMNRLMLDIETLDTEPTAVVFQVGACVFDDSGDIFNKSLWHVDILPQIIRGRTISLETQKFWMAQKEEAWFRMPQEVTTVFQMFTDLNVMIDQKKVGEVWSNSPSFDAVIMRSLAKDFSASPAWDFRQDRDVRTLKKIATFMGWGGFNSVTATTHNAIEDAIDQTNAVVSAFEHLSDVRNMAAPDLDK